MHGKAAATREGCYGAGAMPITYLPADFWGVACTVKGSAIPKVMWRSTYMGLPAVVAALCGQFKHVLNDTICVKDEDETCIYDVPGSFITPFALLVALLTSYRVNSAHAKWDTANRMAMSLHEVSRLIISRLCTTFDLTPENEVRVLRIRRLVVLGCVCIQKNLQGEREWKDELSTGLIEQAEVDRLVTMTATVSVRDQKADKFPTRVRASYFFYYLHKEVYDIFAAHGAAFSPVRAMVEADIGRMTGVFESIELLNMTVLPVAYAQLTRLVCVAFLTVLPFAAFLSLGWGVVILSVAVNMIYFTVDHCASEMEAPFGDDMMDVDLSKIIRRIDKFTASLLSLYVGRPVENYDTYPETRSTGKDHQNLKGAESGLNAHQLEEKRRLEHLGAATRLGRRCHRPKQAHATGSAVKAIASTNAFVADKDDGSPDGGVARLKLLQRRVSAQEAEGRRDGTTASVLQAISLRPLIPLHPPHPLAPLAPCIA